MEDKITEGSIEMIIIGAMVTMEVGIDQERERSFSGNYNGNRIVPPPEKKGI